MSPALIGIAVVFAFYGGIIAVVFQWLKYRTNKRADEIATSLEQQGARILERRRCRSAWKTAEADFEIDGKKATFTVRQWGRDFQLVKVMLPAKKMPPIMVRREMGFDRMGKALGLTTEIQLGDASFDAKHFISTRAPEDVVKRVLSSDATKRAIEDLVNIRYGVFMSSDGVGAGTLAPVSNWTWYLPPFDASSVLRAIEKVEALIPTLPDVGAEHAAPLPQWASPFRALMFVVAFLAAFGATIGFAMTGVHTTIDGRGAPLGLLVGLCLVPVAVIVARRVLHGRPMAMMYIVLVTFAALFLLPMTGMVAAVGLNSALDHSAPEHHLTHVLDRYRGNRRTLYVEAWTPGETRQKVILPSASPVFHIGDALDIETHSGAFGWPWVSSARYAQQ